MIESTSLAALEMSRFTAEFPLGENGTASPLPGAAGKTRGRQEAPVPLSEGFPAPGRSPTRVRILLERLTMRTISGETGLPAPAPRAGEGIPAGPLGRLAEAFTPERTARRIAAFALSGFGRIDRFAEDTPENRKAFGEFIRPAIDRGVEEARGMLGDIEETIDEMIRKTQELVHTLIERFARGEDVATVEQSGDMTESRLVDSDRVPGLFGNLDVTV